MSKYLTSKTIAWLLAIFFVASHYYIRTYNYNNWTNVLGWDVLSYYLYLPFTFIYHDPGMVNQLVIERIFEQYNPSGTFYQAFKIANGNWVPMYTLGFAILFSPFFFIAHLWATLSGNFPADGFSFPYQFCIGNGVMLYIVAGIFVIRKVLLHFFSDSLTTVVLLLTMLGTNYLIEAASDECMPHAMLFTGYALILWHTIKWHQQPAVKHAAWLGFFLGSVILCRGSEIVSLAIPLLWNVYDKKSLQEKWDVIIKHKSHLVAAIVCFFIVPSFQFFYWKMITGNFIFHSYQNTEGFDWNGEHILKVLFSYKKSWFLYTPMIMLPILGIWYMRKMHKQIFTAIAFFFLLNFYLISSWAAWWQGGSFGMRYFVESYAVMTIPFGFFLKKISLQKRFMRIPVYLIVVFFLFLNIFQTWQFNNWIIDGYAMTKSYYWKIFLKTSVTEEDKKLKEVDRGGFKAEETFTNQSDYIKRTLAFYNFETINASFVDSVFIDTSYYLSTPNSCKLTAAEVYSPTFRMPYNIITTMEHAWIRISFDYFPVHDLKQSPASLVIHFDHKGRHALKYKGYDLEKQTFKLNEWNHFTADYLTPYPLSWDDKLNVYVYLRGEKELYIDNLHIEAFERKW